MPRCWRPYIQYTPRFRTRQYLCSAPDEGRSGDDQSSRDMKKHRQDQPSDDQSSREMKKHRRGQSDEQSSRAMKKNDQEAMANSRRMDRDRHGERMRHREARFRHYHNGYYYATPWWTTGMVVGGGIGCGEGARIVSRRGFNRVSTIDCGGATYSYRGWRRGDPWRVRVDSDTGRIVSARPAG